MKELFIRARMIEDDDERDLVIADGVIADADPVPGTEPDAAGWVLPGLADVHNYLSLASPAGDDQDADVRVRASASVELALGVLAIREPGSPDDASARLAGEDGWPRVITAGRFLHGRVLSLRGMDVAFDVDLLTKGRWQDAVELPALGGELLEGLQFPDSPAYEIWLLGERHRPRPPARRRPASRPHATGRRSADRPGPRLGRRHRGPAGLARARGRRRGEPGRRSRTARAGVRTRMPGR
jgi:hypothetical protein